MLLTVVLLVYQAVVIMTESGMLFSKTSAGYMMTVKKRASPTKVRKHLISPPVSCFIYLFLFVLFSLFMPTRGTSCGAGNLCWGCIPSGWRTAVGKECSGLILVTCGLTVECLLHRHHPACYIKSSIFFSVHHSLHKHHYFIVLYFLNLNLNVHVMIFNIVLFHIQKLFLSELLVFNCIFTCNIDLILGTNKASHLQLSHTGFNPQ